MRMHTSLWLLAGCAAVIGPACSSAQPAAAPELLAESTSALSTKISSHESGKNDRHTRTPIKHVVVILGENRSFDHVFATYKAKHGQRVDNILAKHIINEDGSPGPNFSLAIQKSAIDTPPSTYELRSRPRITESISSLMGEQREWCSSNRRGSDEA